MGDEMLRQILVTTIATLLIGAASEGARAQGSTTSGAQAAPGGITGSATQSSAPAQADQLTEIVVTAQRRSETRQRAAISVDAVSAAELLRNAITDSTALNNLIPGLSVQPAGGGLVDYFIRGVGNFTETPYADSAVAFNYDNIYIGRPVASSGPFFDLERVEVLKGPQGTLYGRNATGGAINVIPVKPQLGEFGGYVTGSYGNYNAYNVEGAVNVPIGADTAVRVSANFVGHDAYLSDNTSDEDTKAFRVQILSEPTPELSIRVAADFAEIGGLGGGSNYTDNWKYNPASGQFTVRNSGLGAPTGLYDPASQAYLETITAGPSGRTYGPLAPLPSQNNDLYGINAEITYFTDFGKLTLIPAWRPSTVMDRSALPGFVFETNERDDQYSTELRFAGDRIGMFEYSFGALFYYGSEKGTFGVNQQAAEVYVTDSTYTTSNAGFARVTAHLTDELRLVGGARYTSDDLHFDGASTGLTIVCIRPGCPAAPLFPFTTSLATQPLPYPAKGGGITFLGTTGAIVVRNDEALNASQSNDRSTFRAALEYDVAPDSLAYASVETGYRSGGFNLAVGYPTYEPEYITAYTLGSKNQFFEKRLELNAELFLWKYKNQQISHLGTDLAGNEGNITQNIGRSTNQGVELEARYLLTPSTVLTGNIQYLDAHYDDFTYQAPVLSGAPPYTGCAISANVSNPKLATVNCSGRPSYNAPKYTLDLGIEQTLHYRDYTIVGFVNTQYLTSRFIGFDYQPAELSPAVWHTNAQLTLSPDYAKWSVALFVQNIENHRYAVNDVENPIGNFMVTTTAPPRTFGIRASTQF
jgi:iron complex outermembrane receptor protein